MKLGYHKSTKLTEPDFSGKFLFLVFGAKRVQKGPKIGALSFFSRLLHYFFLLFGMKLGNHNGTKLTEPDFSGKFLIWVFGAKRVQKWPKIGSLSFFSRLLHYFFRIFLHKVRGVQGVQVVKIVRVHFHFVNIFLHEVRVP